MCFFFQNHSKLLKVIIWKKHVGDIFVRVHVLVNMYALSARF